MSLQLTDIVGNRVSRRELARACNCCEDTIDNLTKRYSIPFLKFMGERYYDLEEFRTRVQQGALHNRPDTPRRVGRPPKAVLA